MGKMKINNPKNNVKRLEKMIRSLSENIHPNPFVIICDYCKYLNKCSEPCKFKLKDEN